MRANNMRYTHKQKSAILQKIIDKIYLKLYMSF